jgi:hypothetical protein
MALKGQIVELVNKGKYQFLLKVGVYEDLLGEPLSPFAGLDQENSALPLEKPLEYYSCELDFTDAEKPVSYPMGRLRECMDVYDRYETPEGLPFDTEKQWKVGYIVDTIISEIFGTDILEVVHSDDFEETPSGEKSWDKSPQPTDSAVPLAKGGGGAAPAGRCPDCGAVARLISVPVQGKGQTYVCEVCGRYFTI